MKSIYLIYTKNTSPETVYEIEETLSKFDVRVLLRLTEQADDWVENTHFKDGDKVIFLASSEEDYSLIPQQVRNTVLVTEDELRPIFRAHHYRDLIDKSLELYFNTD